MSHTHNSGRSWNPFGLNASPLLFIFCLFLCSSGSALAQIDPDEDTLFGAQEVRADDMRLSLKVPPNWSVAPRQYKNQVRLINRPEQADPKVPPTSAVKIFTEARVDHADAIHRLDMIARGMNAPESAFLEIGGWPAVQHGRIEQRPKPSKATGTEDTEMYLLSTVIAAGSEVIRMQAMLPSTATRGEIAVARAIGRQLAFDAMADAGTTRKDLNKLRGNAAKRAENKTDNQAETSGGPVDFSAALEAFTEHAPLAEGFNQRVLATGYGEVEIAVSPDAQVIIIGRQGDWVASTDGGQSFPVANTVAAFDGGDPSVAYGQSGAFYYAGIDRGCQAADAAGPNGYTCTGVAQSLDDGATFPLVSPASVCPARPGDIGNNNNPVPGNVGCFPDQHHIAADAWNAGPGGGDQVYNVWRNFDENGLQDPALTCTQDGGQTWTAPVIVDNPGGSSFPRIAVGSDGSVYVAYFDGGNYELRKYSSCATGLVAQPIVTVAARTPVECPFAGHDRCDQNPSSQTVAVDDTNPNHVYYAYAQNAAPGTDNVIVRDSLDGGATWPAGRAVQVNAAIPGSRIMPWVCTTDGQAYVTWYDRRAAPPTQNDLTDFYAGRVGLDGGGNLVAEEEFRISEIGDPWCASGWPCGTRGAPGASESCSVQPQLAGYCTDGGGNTSNRCDFSDCGGVGANTGAPCQCAAGLVCNGGSSTGNPGGCPKYGDYNGNACMAGRLYASWASATSPPGVPPPNAGRIGMLFDWFLLGDVPQINIPGSLDFGNVCESDGVTTETLDVCNTGNANLAVNSISSDNPNFSVTTPGGGYPVTVAPGSCFPFQVEHDADGPGVDTAVLTITSNDPASPEVAVNLEATVGAADINAFIADSGAFGDVCSGSFSDMNLTIQNNGTCALEIDSIALSGADQTSFDLPSGPMMGTIVEAGNSLQVPVRFAPEQCSDETLNANIEIASNSPGEENVQIPISGVSPCPNLVIDPASLSGLHAFPATVVDVGAALGCFSDKSVVLRNNSVCPLTIDGIDTDVADFEVIAPTEFPVTLPGGQETLAVTVRFTPQSDAHPQLPSEVTGVLSIVSDDPDFPHTADLCGESVTQSGLRTLVVDTTSGVPVMIDSVDSMTVRSKGKNTPSPINLMFSDTEPQMATVCGNEVYWHLNLELLPAAETTGSKGGKSQYEVYAKEGNLQDSRTFPLDQCEFNEFQMQLLSTDGGGGGGGSCPLGQKGDACDSADDCCSGKCSGKAGAQTCK
jgi:hypothetical protein